MAQPFAEGEKETGVCVMDLLHVSLPVLCLQGVAAAKQGGKMLHTVSFPILLTQSHSIAGNSFFQVHYFHCLFLLYACTLAAACLALLKVIYVF